MARHSEGLGARWIPSTSTRVGLIQRIVAENSYGSPYPRPSRNTLIIDVSDSNSARMIHLCLPL